MTDAPLSERMLALRESCLDPKGFDGLVEDVAHLERGLEGELAQGRLYALQCKLNNERIRSLIAEVVGLREDAKRLDTMQAHIADGVGAIRLSAWFSKPGGPDGYSVTLLDGRDDSDIEMEEWPTLREAIDAALGDMAIPPRHEGEEEE